MAAGSGRLHTDAEWTEAGSVGSGFMVQPHGFMAVKPSATYPALLRLSLFFCKLGLMIPRLSVMFKYTDK